MPNACDCQNLSIKRRFRLKLKESRIGSKYRTNNTERREEFIYTLTAVGASVGDGTSNRHWEPTDILQGPVMYRQLNIQQLYVLYLCVLCGSENKQRLFPYTALNDFFL
jgi:hypothetical protein